MTRRILLTLGETTTEKKCGNCRHNRVGYCRPFDDYIPDSGLGYYRLRKCLAAEAAAARMVEIEPEDLARCKWSVVGVEADESAERIVWALSEHARSRADD